MEKFDGFIHQLQANDPKITDEEAVAILQHYSKEVGTGTWLIDFTWDPFIALFFASYGGQDKCIGVISYISVSEFDKFSANGTNRVGEIK